MRQGARRSDGDARPAHFAHLDRAARGARDSDVYDGEYDSTLPKINLVTKPADKKINNVLCNAFGFGGTNAVMILGRE